MAKPMNTKNVQRTLKDCGFLPGRKSASHTIWQNGSVSISVPDGHTVISPGVMRKIGAAIAAAA